MKRVMKWFAIVLVVAVVGMQFVRPSRANPPVDESRTIFASGKVPADVHAILDRSCSDCHSHKTVWPWYSHVAPISFLVADDVEHGRKDLNFSTWGDYTPKRAEHKLEEICEHVGDGEMPPRNYLFTHREAALSAADRSRLCEWASAWRAEILR
ncbi:MAG TPA: heme-binding domain-containing protein [Thermoanaerobaculia bacterium]|jgi:hypothetical protein|nr:heme-binding domain-containing protein [Thermoanaerobaculia bacterium]